MTTKKPYESPELVLLDTEENESKTHVNVHELRFCGPGVIGTLGVPCASHNTISYGPS
jgi:hypothetical protein